MAVAMERTVHKVDPGLIKPGDIMLFPYYVKVKEMLHHGKNQYTLVVQDLDNNQGDIKIEGTEVIANAFSANQVHDKVAINQTEMEELLSQAYGKPFTVVFTKQDQTERTLRGRLVGPAPLGRVHVEDLEQPIKERVRLVDLRTVHTLIIDGVKYTVS